MKYSILDIFRIQVNCKNTRDQTFLPIFPLEIWSIRKQRCLPHVVGVCFFGFFFLITIIIYF